MSRDFEPPFIQQSEDQGFIGSKRSVASGCVASLLGLGMLFLGSCEAATIFLNRVQEQNLQMQQLQQNLNPPNYDPMERFRGLLTVVTGDEDLAAFLTPLSIGLGAIGTLVSRHLYS